MCVTMLRGDHVAQVNNWKMVGKMVFILLMDLNIKLLASRHCPVFLAPLSLLLFCFV